MNPEKKTKELWHAELRGQFMDTVKKMIKSDCALPMEFQLFYCVEERVDRSEHTVHAIPFLTKEKAMEAWGPDCEEGGRVSGERDWSRTHYAVVGGENDGLCYCAKYNIEYLY